MNENIPLLELRNIRKTYPGVVALDNVSLSVLKGEVHALLGENGAGKSTLIKTCAGAISPDSGEIYFDGKIYNKMTPEKSIQAGIGVIYQEFNLVNALTVSENIFLGRAIKKGIFIDKEAMNKKARDIFELLEIDIEPTALVSSLTVGYQQMVEIAKALSQNVKLIIMDEPSAPLTKAETETLYKVVELLKSKGISVIYISHRLEDIFRLADRCTFLRDGHYIDTVLIKECNEEKMISLMVGRKLEEKFPKRPNVNIGNTILKLENVEGEGVKGVSLEVKKGEILGLGGLIGAGRSELTEIIFGARKMTSGKMIFDSKEYAPKSPKEAIKEGIGLVPEDRKQHGLILPESVNINVNLPIIKKEAKFTFINKKLEVKTTEKYCDELQVKTPNINQLVGNLSGGNQQKVVIAKWLASNAKFIILDEPTRGIDVGAKFEIYKVMHKLVEEGKTILMVSSEMEELLGMCDRIAVLSEGRLTGIIDKKDFSQEKVMSYASIKGGKNG